MPGRTALRNNLGLQLLTERIYDKLKKITVWTVRRMEIISTGGNYVIR